MDETRFDALTRRASLAGLGAAALLAAAPLAADAGKAGKKARKRCKRQGAQVCGSWKPSAAHPTCSPGAPAPRDAGRVRRGTATLLRAAGQVPCRGSPLVPTRRLSAAFGHRPSTGSGRQRCRIATSSLPPPYPLEHGPRCRPLFSQRTIVRAGAGRGSGLGSRPSRLAGVFGGGRHAVQCRSPPRRSVRSTSKGESHRIGRTVRSHGVSPGPKISEVSEVTGPPSPFFSRVRLLRRLGWTDKAWRKEGWETTDFTDFTDFTPLPRAAE